LSASAPGRKKVEPTLGLPTGDEVAGISVTPATFNKFQQLIHEETGIWLGEAKMALLCGRLARRLRTLGLERLDQYYDIVARPEENAERIAMIDAITTNETRFFREPRHFDFLENKVIPQWQTEAQEGRRPKTVRVWSAGCSSGEEPYSLAMLFATHLPPEQGWKTTILATDISTRVLEKARTGVYEIAKSSEIPEAMLKRFMLRGIDKEYGRMKVMPSIQTTIEFRRFNLKEWILPPAERFDAIFCRNVLIYFDNESKIRVVERLAQCLDPHGFFFLGLAENLSGMKTTLRSLAPAIYGRAGEQHDA
jgi:chemotaxis protein methyltransferase CheR